MTELKDNFVPRISKTVQEYFDVPPEFADAVGLGIVSACFGPFFKSTWVPQGDCNLYIVLSSKPSFTRRSNAQSVFDYVVKKVYQKEVEKRIIEQQAEQKIIAERKKAKDALKAKEEQQEVQPVQDPKKRVRKKKEVEEFTELTVDQLDAKVKEFTENFFIEGGNEEGITDDLQVIKEGKYKNMYVMFNSREFGAILKKMFDDNSWEKGIAIILSKLFYGEGGKVFMSRRGGKAPFRYVPEGMYAVVFAGMQEMRLYMSIDAIKQGTGRRILIIYHEPCEADIARYMDYINSKREGWQEELDKIVEEVFQKREYIKSCLEHNQEYAEERVYDKIPNTMDIILSSEVVNSINSFAKEKYVQFIHNPSDENTVRQSEHEHLTRIAFCYEIAKTDNLGFFNETNGLYCGKLKKDSYEFAKEFMNKVTKSTEGQYDKLDENPLKPINVSTKQDELYQSIVAAGDQGLTFAQLGRNKGWDDKVIENLLMRLFREEKIFQHEFKTTKPRLAWIASTFKLKGQDEV